MKQITIALLLLTLFANGTYAQRKAYRHAPKKIKKVHTLFLEGGGNGIYGSINYDRVINFSSFALSLRAGLGAYPSSNVNTNAIYPVLPIEVSTLWGKKTHFIEAGVGISTLYLYKTNGQDKPRYIFLGFARIGYRLQKDSGFFFKAGFTPIFAGFSLNEANSNQQNFRFLPWVGVAVGEAF